MTFLSVSFCFILRYCLKRNNEQMDREDAEDVEMTSREDKSGVAVPNGPKRIRYVL